MEAAPTLMDPVFRGRLWRPPSSDSNRALVAAATAEVAAAAAEKIQRSAERRRRRTAYPLVNDQQEVQAHRVQEVGRELQAYRHRMFARGCRHSADRQAVSNVARREDIARTDVEAKLMRVITQHDVMLFMKGNPETPRCGMSSRAVTVLQDAHIEFESVDILREEDVRQGLKALSGYPTYPQLYYRGKFVGGVGRDTAPASVWRPSGSRRTG